MANVARQKPGPSTILNDILFSKIRESIINGNSLKETANVCEIPESTLYGWSSDNYLMLADKIEGWKRDAMLKQAEGNLKEFLKMDCKNVRQVGEELIHFTDAQLVRIKQDTSKFVAQTLGKGTYSTSTETKNLNVNVDIEVDGSDLEGLADILNKQLKNGHKGNTTIES